MFDWLKQRLGIHGSANHEAVPDAVVDAIARDLARIRNPGEGVLEAVLKYIVEGGEAPKASSTRSGKRKSRRDSR
jgi:hypothetical protein